MKKVFTLLLLILLPLMASSQTEIAGIYYYLYSYGETKTARVTSDPDKYSGDIVIPSTVTYNDVTYSVTSIGSSAFSGCTELTSVTIPESVTSIGSYAFQDCSGLTSVTIGDGVETIGHSAFNNCGALTSVTIPNSVTSIGDYAFWDCSGLTSITIPNSVTSIGGSAFRECVALTSIVVEGGNSVYDSRDNCNAIIETQSHELIVGCMNTIIPNSVTSIGYEAFYKCSGLWRSATEKFGCADG